MQGFELPDTSWRCRSVTMHNIRLWEHLERFFSPLFFTRVFLLAPAAAASEPARAKTAPHGGSCRAGPGPALGFGFGYVLLKTACATPRGIYKATERLAQLAALGAQVQGGRKAVGATRAG
jgi:hypothetical protein